MPPLPIHILLIEDDDLDVMNVQRALKGNPAVRSLHIARDGIEALELLRSGQLARERLVVLTDLRMPRMSGLELLRELRSSQELSHLPAVVLTTSNDAEDRRAAYALHVAGYLVKPVDPLELRERLASFTSYWSSVELPS